MSGTTQKPRMRGEQHQRRRAFGVLHSVMHAQAGADRDAEVHGALAPRGIHDRLDVAHLILERRHDRPAVGEPRTDPVEPDQTAERAQPRRKRARYGSSHARSTWDTKPGANTTSGGPTPNV